MQELLQELLQFVGRIPDWSIYALVGAGAAVENVFPPVPSDTFVLLGAILAEEQILRFDLVFAVAWGSNVALAMGVYGMGLRYGRTLFETQWGQRVLRPHQLDHLQGFYHRYGTMSVLFSRFLPVFRVIVPAFAGVSRLGFWRTLVPLGLASGLWYALLLWVGAFAARNIPRLVSLVDQAQGGLWAVAGVVAAAVAAWWWRTRHREYGSDEDAEEGP